MWCCHQNGYSALVMACLNGHLDVVRWLVTSAGSDARSESTNVSCLFRRHRECLRRQKHRHDLCYCDQYADTALLLACANGHLDVARWLVTDAGSNARSQQSDVSCTPFAVRSRWEFGDATRRLVCFSRRGVAERSYSPLTVVPRTTLECCMLAD
jgi:ankyrin repeat protein